MCFYLCLTSRRPKIWNWLIYRPRSYVVPKDRQLWLQISPVPRSVLISISTLPCIYRADASSRKRLSSWERVFLKHIYLKYLKHTQLADFRFKNGCWSVAVCVGIHRTAKSPLTKSMLNQKQIAEGACILFVSSDAHKKETLCVRLCDKISHISLLCIVIF